MSQSDRQRFPEAVREILHRGGWSEGRNAATSVPPGFELFPAAKSVLEEFAGLQFGEVGPGIDCATSDIEFDSALADGLQGTLRRYEASVGARLCPLGEFHNGHAYLVLDEFGRVYYYLDDLVAYAPTFDRALELLLLGKEATNEELQHAGMNV